VINRRILSRFVMGKGKFLYLPCWGKREVTDIGTAQSWLNVLLPLSEVRHKVGLLAGVNFEIREAVQMDDQAKGFVTAKAFDILQHILRDRISHDDAFPANRRWLP